VLLATKLLGTALGVAATFAGCAAAATLALSSKSLAAGNAAVSTCGVSSVAATRNVDNAGNVTEVGVTGVPAGCAGETLSVTLVGAGNAALATASAALGSCTTSCSADLTGFASVAAANVVSYSFAVSG
jgi:hypothetical protein